MVPKNTFIVWIEEDDLEEEGELYIIVTINTVKCWNENKHLCDHYTDKECKLLNDTLEELNLSELMESTFETDFNSVEEARKVLLEHGFEENQDFTDFMLKMKDVGKQ